jgi:uroporphyrin-III C-methyltransferase
MGKVFLVGAGPGSLDLLTVKAVRVLGQAEVLLHDRLVNPDTLGLAPAQAERIDVGKRPGAVDAQPRILEIMENRARAGLTVVRLKGGDPMVFGRGGEEWLHLADRGIEVELVPGISSAVAVPGLAGIPLTHRGLATSFAVLTGKAAGGTGPDCAQYAGVDTLVILMGVSERRSIARHLIEAGRPVDEPVAFIERGTTADQRIMLADLQAVENGEVEVEAPAVLVVGRVVELHSKLGRAIHAGVT